MISCMGGGEQRPFTIAGYHNIILAMNYFGQNDNHTFEQTKHYEKAEFLELYNFGLLGGAI